MSDYPKIGEMSFDNSMLRMIEEKYGQEEMFRVDKLSTKEQWEWYDDLGIEAES